MKRFVTATAVALAMTAGSANAAFTVYTSLAAFNAATTAQSTDTFAGFSITGVTPSPITRTVGAYGYTAAAANGFFGAGTTANPWLSTNTATDPIVFSAFTGGVQALGGNFFGSNIVGAFEAGNITLTFTDSLGATLTQTITNATTSSFLGVVSTGNVTGLTVAAVQGTNPLWPTVDNLVLARRSVVQGAIPEPATWAMMISGFGLIGAAMRRRRIATTVSFA